MKKQSLVAGVLLALLFLAPSSGASENSRSFEIVELHDSAWVSHGASSNKFSAGRGDSLRQDDILEVLAGNTVKIAPDPESRSALLVEGGTTLAIGAAGMNKSFTVEHGRVYAFVEKLTAGTTFKVMTPTTIAAVRGTQLQVNVNANKTLVFNYDGTIEIYTRDAHGAPSGEFTLLKSGEKISVEGAAAQNIQAVEMNSEEMAEIKNVPVFHDPPAASKSAEDAKKEDNIKVKSYFET